MEICRQSAALFILQFKIIFFQPVSETGEFDMGWLAPRHLADSRVFEPPSIFWSNFRDFMVHSLFLFRFCHRFL